MIKRVMHKPTRMAIYGSAAALWAMAVLGAIGVAWWLVFSSRDTMLLVLAVAVIAIFGAFVPAVQLGRTRELEKRDGSTGDRR